MGKTFGEALLETVGSTRGKGLPKIACGKGGSKKILGRTGKRGFPTVKDALKAQKPTK